MRLWFATGATALGLAAGFAAPYLDQAAAATGTIITVAGRSVGYSGDGGQARDAQMNEPRMATFDGAGNMYIVDTFNEVIRRVDTSGIITTVAGHSGGYVPRDETDCPANFSGEGGPATQATLACPHSVTVAENGDLYIADSANHVIRRVDHAGIITTVAGRGGRGGDDGDGGPAPAAHLNDPKGVVFDHAGNLFLTDSGNNKVKRIDAATGIITTIAGNGGAGSAGDGGPATAAKINEPRTIALAADGAVLVTEPKENRIRRIDTAGIITTFAGNGKAAFSGDGGPAKQAALNFARGVAVDGAGDVYIADSLNQRIRKVDHDGIIRTVAGRGRNCYISPREHCGDDGPAADAGFATPRAIDFDAAGNLYVADTFNSRIRMIEGAAAPVRRTSGAGPG